MWGRRPNLIERIVGWLGKLSPALFEASGACQDTALLILGYSLAVWALVAFSACVLLGGWAQLRSGHSRT